MNAADIPPEPLREVGSGVRHGFPLPVPRPLMPEHEQKDEEDRDFAGG